MVIIIGVWCHLVVDVTNGNRASDRPLGGVTNKCNHHKHSDTERQHLGRTIKDEQVSRYYLPPPPPPPVQLHFSYGTFKNMFLKTAHTK